jgi:hypothetical protein
VDHLRVDEVAGAKNPPDLAAVAISVGDFDADGVTEDFGGERVSRLGAENLCSFGGVNAGEANLVLNVGRIEHGQGVPVSDLHDLADERVPGRRTAGAGREDENQDEREAFHGGNCSARTVESIDFAREASRVSQAGAPTDSTAWLAGTFVRRRADQFAIGLRAILRRNLLLQSVSMCQTAAPVTNPADCFVFKQPSA